MKGKNKMSEKIITKEVEREYDEIQADYNKKCLYYMKKYKEKEEWKHVIYKDEVTDYMISNYGRIVDLRRRIVPNMLYVNNHYSICMRYGKNKSRIMGVYRLVALAFIPVPQKYLDMGYTIDDLVVDHKRDGDPDNFDDNTVWNLQWLTRRENTSKAAKCGFRPAYPIDFRSKLDEMILNDCKNSEIYDYMFETYGYDKKELKAQVQVRRRRLGKTLKEHFERDKDFIKAADKLLKKGLSNDQIMDILDMPREGRSSTRFLQYRRTVLGIPAQVSKYFTNEENEEINKLLVTDIPIEDIMKKYGLDTLPDLDRVKVYDTLKVRRRQHLNKLKITNTVHSSK